MSFRFRLSYLGIFVPLLAGSAVHAAEFKAGFVDLNRAMLEIDEGRAAKARLQKMMEEKQKELDREQGALRKEMETLQKQATAMSEEARLKKHSELQQRAVALGQKWEKTQNEMTQRQRAEVQQIFKKMDPIIAEIAQREGLTIVFEKADAGLVYAVPALDFTNEMVRLYNARAVKTAPAPKDAPAKQPNKPVAPSSDKK